LVTTTVTTVTTRTNIVAATTTTSTINFITSLVAITIAIKQQYNLVTYKISYIDKLYSIT